VALSATVESGLMVRADSSLLRRVVENLVQNSLEYTPIHGADRARGPPPLRRGDRRQQHRPGDPARSARAHLREIPARPRGVPTPLVTRGSASTSASARLEAHGGSVSVAETPEWPTTFLLHLPAA